MWSLPVLKIELPPSGQMKSHFKARKLGFQLKKLVFQIATEGLLKALIVIWTDISKVAVLGFTWWIISWEEKRTRGPPTPPVPSCPEKKPHHYSWEEWHLRKYFRNVIKSIINPHHKTDYRHCHVINFRRIQLADHPETPRSPSVVCGDHTLRTTAIRNETASSSVIQKLMVFVFFLGEHTALVSQKKSKQ